MSTTDDKTPDPTPALLPPARLAAVRDDADTCREALDEGALDFKHCEQEVYDAAYRLIAEGTRAPLAHLDALTPRAPVDGEALGRGLWKLGAHRMSKAEEDWLWDTMPADRKTKYVEGALAIHAIGHAAGRGEGEAERAEQSATIARLTAEREGWTVLIRGHQDENARLTASLADLDVLYQEQVRESQRLAADRERMEDERDAATAELAEARAALRTETTMKEQVQDQLVEMRGKHREEWERAERLTAELAEARAAVEAFRALPGYPHTEGVTPAMVKLRLEANGAQKEREACALIAEDEERLLYRQDGEQACARVRRRIRARTTEGRQG